MIWYNLSFRFTDDAATAISRASRVSAIAIRYSRDFDLQKCMEEYFPESLSSKLKRPVKDLRLQRLLHKYTEIFSALGGETDRTTQRLLAVRMAILYNYHELIPRRLLKGLFGTTNAMHGGLDTMHI